MSLSYRLAEPADADAASRILTAALSDLCASRPFGHFERYLLAGDCLL